MVAVLIGGGLWVYNNIIEPPSPPSSYNKRLEREPKELIVTPEIPKEEARVLFQDSEQSHGVVAWIQEKENGEQVVHIIGRIIDVSISERLLYIASLSTALYYQDGTPVIKPKETLAIFIGEEVEVVERVPGNSQFVPSRFEEIKIDYFAWIIIEMEVDSSPEVERVI